MGFCIQHYSDLRQNLSQKVNLQSTLHTLPTRASYMVHVFIMRIWEKIDCVIHVTAPHCILISRA